MKIQLVGLLIMALGVIPLCMTLLFCGRPGRGAFVCAATALVMFCSGFLLTTLADIAKLWGHT